jgi:hypothetical protein
MAKVSVSTKHGTDHNQENRVYGRHDDDTTNSVGPRAVFKRTLKAQYVFHSRANLSEKRRSNNVRKGRRILKSEMALPIKYTNELTSIIVEEPVMANTVEISSISRYHFGVLRGGISFAARNVWNQVFDGGGGGTRGVGGRGALPLLENERLYPRFKFLAVPVPVPVDDERWFDRGAVTKFLNAALFFQKDKVAVLRAARDKEQVGIIMVTSSDYYFVSVDVLFFVPLFFALILSRSTNCDSNL